MAFVAVELFPRLVAERAALVSALGISPDAAVSLELHLALAGAMVAFGLYRWVKADAGHGGVSGKPAAAATIAVYAALKACVGYLLAAALR